ncbi:hypothetical protein COT48_03370 [Candidatus Woesearchaeota archaeon CG08_land_8_20_14_0_20_47_9]|nr:MAG: hypothetical protein AUJ69_03265 [Candidatus Woesearchaeota archaeon CG1_02_47_18]PIN75765.1 MAG: hypothetical protein COV22_00730 [Candidatus Woesearchaeota archaeon CG10_big_fil_rev_8_21_14_0_10_47_5]PIO03808.1 MAG: hypothetical protein COT48_03370 [Candidatus Woesearchaeota archaeon CG08_land_8_20_14_0_20_47_9]HII29861.1 hypothetical protein [Candidatus Woesearchaeota archaeon]
MRYKCRSLILGKKKDRKARDDTNPELCLCFVNLCNENNPHLSEHLPFKFLEFEIHKVIIEGLDVYFLVPGKDIVINNLESVDIVQEGPHLFIRGKQGKESKAGKKAGR